MSFYYLIDFENVREAGISSLAPTDNTDHIYVFYTDNASKLNMDAFLNHEAELKFIKVAAGKQSLDMHLISVLGFLLRDQGDEKKYVIVSRDGGYDNVIRFWKEKGFAVSRDMANLPAMETAASAEKTVQPKKSGSKRGTSNRRNNSRKKEKQGQISTEEIAETTSATVIEITETENTVPETVVENMEEPEESIALGEEIPVLVEEPIVETVEEESVSEETATEIVEEEPTSEEPISAEPTTEAVEEKTVITETVAEPEETPREVDSHTLMNNKLMSLLRNKTDANTCGAIASIVVRNMDEKNYKQVIYRAMVKKFGQKNGLENYNLIKKEI